MLPDGDNGGDRVYTNTMNSGQSTRPALLEHLAVGCQIESVITMRAASRSASVAPQTRDLDPKIEFRQAFAARVNVHASVRSVGGRSRGGDHTSPHEAAPPHSQPFYTAYRKLGDKWEVATDEARNFISQFGVRAALRDPDRRHGSLLPLLAAFQSHRAEPGGRPCWPAD